MSLRRYLESIQDPRTSKILAVYDRYRDLVDAAPGSSHNHQAWPGGYADHILEILKINDVVYDALSTIRPLPFTPGSAAVCLFFHDIEKPFKYAPEGHSLAEKYHAKVNDLRNALGLCNRTNSVSESDVWEELKKVILSDIFEEFDLSLSESEWNALKFTHGEGSSHRKDCRVAGPLAAHVHHCDNTSARIWFDKGREEDEPKLTPVTSRS